jgi:tetratricopeptide (TPR) repeat protein
VLAEDLRRFGAGESIQARPVGHAERLWRWCRRKPVVAGLAASVAMLLVTLIVGTLGAAIRLGQERNMALRHQAEAERNFRQARDAVDSYLTQISENPDLKAHGLEPLRRRLLEMARDYYQRFVQDHHGDPMLRAELGWAYGRLASLTSELGDKEAALQMFGQAQAGFTELAREHPGEPQHQYDLAQTQLDRGRVLDSMGQSGADMAILEARNILTTLVHDYPSVPNYSLRLAQCHNDLAVFYRNRGRVQEARAAFQEAGRIQEQVVRLHPNTPQYQVALTSIHNNLGDLLQVIGQRPEAEAAYQEARRILEALVQANRMVPEYQFKLSQTHNNLFTLYAEGNQWPAAEAAYQAARQIQEGLVRQHPYVPLYQGELALTLFNAGTLYVHAEQLREAEQLLGEARTLYERLASNYPQVPQHQFELTKCLLNLSIAYLDTQQWAQAAAVCREAQKIQEPLAEKHPDMPDYRVNLARIYNQLGRSASKQKDWADAEAVYMRAWKTNDRLVRDYPAVLDFAYNLGAVCHNLAIVALRQNKSQDALDWFGKAVAAFQPVNQKNPADARVRGDLLNSYSTRAHVYLILGQYTEALQDLDRALVLDTGQQREQLQLHRAVALSRLKEHAKATEQAHVLAQGKAVSGSTLYDLACVYAVSSAAAAQDPNIALAEQNLLGERYAQRGIELLTDARAAGIFKDSAKIELLKKDEDLHPLRSRADFQKLLAEVEAQAGAK